MRKKTKQQKMTRTQKSAEVIGWKIKPKGWYPEIGLFDTQSQRDAKRRAAEKEAEKKVEKIVDNTE